MIVLEGDGALLMNLGILATVGAARPANLLAVVLDNGRYESSGGQALPEVRADFVAIARAVAFAVAERVADVAALPAALTRASGGGGPALLVLPTAFDPTERIPPYTERPAEIRVNFARAVGGSRRM